MIATADILAYAPWAAGMVAGMALRGLFAGMETGVYVLNKIRLDLRAEQGLRSARRLRRLMQNPNNLLAVLLIGTNVTSYFATVCLTSMLILAGLGASVEWITIFLWTPVLFIFAESVPKNVYQRLAERAVYATSPLLSIANALLLLCGASPLVRGFGAALMKLVRRGQQADLFAHAGISAVMAEGHASGVLTHFQTVMADRVSRIGTVTLGDVMVPMGRVVSAPVGVDRDALRETFRDHNYSRLPLIGDDGRVAGVLDIYDALTGAAPTAESMTPAVRLSADLNITDALYRMQRTGTMLAVVESGDRDIGIVTVKDLVEEIVGELQAW